MSNTKQVSIRKPYDASVRSAISFPHASRTKQQFVEESDINTIMRKYEKTGVIDPRLQRGPGSYGDFSNATDYHTSLTQIVEAQDAFYDLPASLRKRFNNDPAELLDFLADDRNRDEAIKLGLVPAPEPEAPPTKVEVVSPPQPKDEAKPKSSGAEGRGDQSGAA